jgi:hypothetical protein
VGIAVPFLTSHLSLYPYLTSVQELADDLFADLGTAGSPSYASPHGRNHGHTSRRGSGRDDIHDNLSTSALEAVGSKSGEQGGEGEMKELFPPTNPPERSFPPLSREPSMHMHRDAIVIGNTHKSASIAEHIEPWVTTGKQNTNSERDQKESGQGHKSALLQSSRGGYGSGSNDSSDSNRIGNRVGGAGVDWPDCLSPGVLTLPHPLLHQELVPVVRKVRVVLRRCATFISLIAHIHYHL